MAHAPEATEIELRTYLRVLRRRRLLIAVVTLVCVGASIVATVLQAEVYRASAELLLQPRTSELLYSPGRARADSVSTEIAVMQSVSVHEAVEKRVGHPVAYPAIAAKGDTTVVTVSVESGDPDQAADAANTYVETYIALRREQQINDLLVASEQIQKKVDDIQIRLAGLPPMGEDPTADAERVSLESQRATYTSQLGQLQLATNLTQTGGAELVSAAQAPGKPIRPTPKRNAVAGLFAGFVLGVGAAFLLEYLDDTIRSKDDLERSAGLTVIGMIPLVGGWRDRTRATLVSISEPASPAAEAYRTLRTSVEFLGIESPIKVMQITSPTASEGKTTTLANLAVALVRSGKRVTIVCADLRRPRLHEFFGLTNAIGFTSVLLGDVALDKSLQDIPGVPGLRLLASGPVPPNPSELLGSTKAAHLITSLREDNDIVLIDTPPVLPVTDSLVVSRVVDASIVVVTAGKANRRDVHRAVELLQQVDAPIVGALLNGVRSETGYGYGYGYGYGAYTPDSREHRGRRRDRADKSSSRSNEKASTSS
jgi:capsular exopolysaccharide synthesis family protein